MAFSLTSLNAISESKYVNFDQLNVGSPYKILGFNTYKTSAYKKDRVAVRVDIEEGFLILPERFDAALNDILSMSTENLYIIYSGRQGKGNRLKIEFKQE